MTIGDRDKVFADLGNPQPESNPENGGDAGEAKLGIVVHEVPPAVAAKIHSLRRGHRFGAHRLIC